MLKRGVPGCQIGCDSGIGCVSGNGDGPRRADILGGNVCFGTWERVIIMMSEIAAVRRGGKNTGWMAFLKSSRERERERDPRI